MRMLSNVLTVGLLSALAIGGYFVLRAEEVVSDDSHGDHHGGHHGEGETEESVGVISLPEEAMIKHDIRLSEVGPGTILHELELPGEIALDGEKVAHIVPRFAGIVLRVDKRLGDRVNAGDVLAVIQSNQSVAPYEVKSLVEGVVIAKHITLGEFVRDDADIFIIADLSTVWVNIGVYAKYLDRVKPGQKVKMTATGIREQAEGTVDYVGPLVGERTRTGVARVVLKNTSGVWQPGLFVTAMVLVDTQEAALAVPDAAIQMVEGASTVFVRKGQSFEARTVQLGRSDGSTVEILDGLQANEQIAITNSFLLKAEFGKSEAGHNH